MRTTIRVPLSRERSESDLLELGREVEEDPTLDGMSRAGRPLTNTEMSAAMLYRRTERRKAEDFLREEL